jgi:hypothetical protein
MIANVAVDPFSPPVMTACVTAPTSAALAVKGAVVDPAGTETEAGTVRKGVLEASVTV